MRFRYHPKTRRRFSRNNLFQSRTLFMKRFRRRRGVGRMMSRRRTKPELKFALLERTAELNPQSRTIITISPTAMAQGTAENERIGGEIKSMRNQFRFQIWSSNDYQEDPPDAGDRSTVMVRCLIWSPRISYVGAETYLNSIDLLEPIDFNVCTIHHDFYFTLGNEHYVFEQATINITAGQFMGPSPVPGIRYFQKYTKFPRKIKFRPNSNDIDPNKDVLYLMFINATGLEMTYKGISRTTFIDV